jgi:release factor glutamine methyltransferase
VSVRALVTELRTALAASTQLEADVRADAAREAVLLVAGVLDVAPGVVTRMSAANGQVSAADSARVREAAARRQRGEPLSYCTGSVGFRDLVLAVDARVLIPRSETEIVVEEALRVTAASPGGIAVDIGTGSGAIALSLATEGRFDRVIATDLSTDALAVARVNAVRVGVVDKVEFRPGADLAPLADLKPPGPLARVIVSNPPYIAYTEAAALPESVREWEPPVALYADQEGMARYIALLAGAPMVLESGGWLVLEVDARRAQRTADLAVAEGYQQVRLARDLAGRDRVLVARWTS